jgi:N-acetylmuramoyl-L-alanine amidase
MRTYTIKQGECLASVARRFGITDPMSIYQHPSNAQFRALRPNPGLLFPGDTIKIPDQEQKNVVCLTGKMHTFVIDQPTRCFRLRLRSASGEPLAHAPYRLTVESIDHEGTTDDQGTLEQHIPADAIHGILHVGGWSSELRLGHLNPLRESPDEGISGVQARLLSLGYAPGPLDGPHTPQTKAAIIAFQQANQLPATGTIDSALLEALERAHGC